MEIKCPSCSRKFVIRKPGRYKCTQCGATLPAITASDMGVPVRSGAKAPSGLDGTAGPFREAVEEMQPAPTPVAAAPTREGAPGPRPARPEAVPAGEPEPPASGPGQSEATPSGAPLPEALLAKVTAFEQQITASPSTKAPYMLLAQLYLDNGRKDLAVLIYERFLKIDPKNAFITNKVALLSGKATSRMAVDYKPPVDSSAVAATQRNVVRYALIGAAAVVVIAAFFVARAFFFPGGTLINPEGGAWTAAWSPKGNALGFVAEREGGSALMLFDPKKKTVRQAVRLDPSPGGSGPLAWSPTGREIAYSAFTSDPERGMHGEAIFVVDVRSGETRRICLGKEPSWSSDGTAIAFLRQGSYDRNEERGRDKEVGLWVADALTSAQTRIFDKQVENVSCSPKEDMIVFTVPDKVDWEAYAAKAGTGEGQDTFDPGRIAENALEGGTASAGESRRNLAREMEAAQHASGGRPGRGVGALLHPANIYVSDAAGTSVRPLTSDSRSYAPVWTPDGRWIVFNHFPPGQDDVPEVWRMRNDGSERQRLAGPGIDIPDSRTVAFSPKADTMVIGREVENVNPGIAVVMTGNDAVDLFKVSMGGTRLKRLENRHPFKAHPLISPDGKKLAYDVFNPDTRSSELWLMSF